MPFSDLGINEFPEWSLGEALAGSSGRRGTTGPELCDRSQEMFLTRGAVAPSILSGTIGTYIARFMSDCRDTDVPLSFVNTGRIADVT